MFLLRLVSNYLTFLVTVLFETTTKARSSIGNYGIFPALLLTAALIYVLGLHLKEVEYELQMPIKIWLDLVG